MLSNYNMEQTQIKNINENLARLVRDVRQIKQMLITSGKNEEDKEMEEIELTDWAKKELEEARKRKTKIPHEEIRKIIFAK